MTSLVRANILDPIAGLRPVAFPGDEVGVVGP